MTPGAVWQHLWQSTLFAGIVFVVAMLAKRAPARIRHKAWLLASAKFTLPASMLASLAAETIRLLHVPALPPAASSLGRVMFPLRFTTDMPEVVSAGSAWPLVLAAMWLCGLVLCLCRWRRQWTDSRRALQSVREPDRDERAAVEAARARMGVRTRVRAVISEPDCEPAVYGFFRPILVLPDGLKQRLTPRQFESVLLHEMEHVAARDNLTGAWQRFVSAVFWFHPLLWWLDRRVALEREVACDEAVLRAGIQPREYTAAILECCRLPFAGMVPGWSGVGSPGLSGRLERIMSNERSSAGWWQRLAIATLAGLVLLFPLMVGWATRASAQDATSELKETKILPANPAKATSHQALLDNLSAALHPRRISADESAKVSGPYAKWLDEDVAGLITDPERAAFVALGSDAEREHFIEQFWQRRDPTPDTPQNEFKEEYYRRIGYASGRFGRNGAPGAFTDRGLVYRALGPPDEIESHPRPDGSGAEAWKYNHLDGTDDALVLTFVLPPNQ